MGPTHSAMSPETTSPGRIVRQSSVRLPDALVAATALDHNPSIATRSRKHFEPIRGIHLRAFELGAEEVLA